MLGTVFLFSLRVCQWSSAHHLWEGGLYDSHHQALQTDDLLHVKAHWWVSDGIGAFCFLRGPLLCVRLVRAAVLSQADRRCAGGVFHQVADFSQTVSDEAVKQLGGHDGGSRTCMSVKHAPEVERDSCSILKKLYEYNNVLNKCSKRKFKKKNGFKNLPRDYNSEQKAQICEGLQALGLQLVTFLMLSNMLLPVQVLLRSKSRL